MKYAFALFFTLACQAASWDGTKGNITVTSECKPGVCTITVSSSDATVNDFIVVASVGHGIGTQTLVKIASQGLLAGRLPVPARVTINADESEISGVLVTEVHLGQAQFFQ